MNPGMLDTVADQHIRELRRQATRRQATRRQAAARHRDRPAGDAGPLPRLRSRLGFVLVEAGFCLLASARLASRD